MPTVNILLSSFLSPSIDFQVENLSIELYQWLEQYKLLTKNFRKYALCPHNFECCENAFIEYNKNNRPFYLCESNYLQGEQYIEEQDRVAYTLNIQRLLNLYCQANNIKRVEEYYYNKQYQAIGINLDEQIIHLLVYKPFDANCIHQIKEITTSYKNVYLLTLEQAVHQNNISLLPDNMSLYSIEELFQSKSFKFLEEVIQPEENNIILSICLDTRKTIYIRIFIISIL